MKTIRENTLFEPHTDFIRVATATPEVSIGNVSKNSAAISKLYKEAAEKDVSLLVFPELSLTGYSIQDLVFQDGLLKAARDELTFLADTTAGQNTALVVGLPLQVANGLYNCAAVIANGKVRGVVPKTNLPTYNEFYEKRWYQNWTGQKNTSIEINNESVVFGTQQLFKIGTCTFGIEICEDLWVPEQPSIELVAEGATIIVNPSASPEAVAKAAYRRGLVSHTAARTVSAYVYSSADQTESTAEIVMGGHAMINELGTPLAERAPFTTPQRLMIADLDMQHIKTDRIKNTNFPNRNLYTSIETDIFPVHKELMRDIDPSPFTPKGNKEEIYERLETILNIQATGLAMRFKSSPTTKIVMGLSGGLDSTLALLVALRAAKILGIPARELIHTLTMPGAASSDRTQNNAVALAEGLEVANEEIPISELAKAQLHAIHHQGDEDTTYENTQARIRQALVFNKANQLNGIALGTGDLSEIALGWCTYNGDHMSHYNVNASIPKSLVKMLVKHAAAALPKDAQQRISDILATPISPELTGNGEAITQSTEDLVGPYELHDFFLYHLLRWRESKAKILYLAERAFADSYSKEEIKKWLEVFYTRFTQNQWKRQAMPDGAKVGLSLSPKGDWRMPPEAQMLY